MDGGSHSLAQEAQREPPHSIEAEQGLLGALLADNGVWERVCGWLRPEHFANVGHGALYDLCGRLIDDGKTASPVTLQPFVADLPEIPEAGGLRYLLRLAQAVASAVNAEEYGRQIKDGWTRRRAIALGQALIEDAWSADPDASGVEVAARHAEALDGLVEDGAGSRGAQRMGQVSRSVLERAMAAARGEVVVAISTGLPDVDRQLGGGLFPGDLILVAGRPSMGKTAICENIAANAARVFQAMPRAEGDRRPPERREGARVAFVSLEMSGEALAARLIVREAAIPGVGTQALRTGQVWGPGGPEPLSEGLLQRLTEAGMATDAWPLEIIDDVYDLRAIGAELRKLKRRQGLDLVIVDYLQLLDLPEGADNRTVGVGALSRGCKQLAQRLSVPLVLLSQLSRAVESRDDKRPQLSDLRDSGAIEADADVVCFLYREQYYLERGEPVRKPEENDEKFDGRYRQWLERCEKAHNVAEVIIQKQRMGPIGSVRLYFDPAFGQFGSLAKDQGDYQ